MFPESSIAVQATMHGCACAASVACGTQEQSHKGSYQAQHGYQSQCWAINVISLNWASGVTVALSNDTASPAMTATMQLPCG